MEFSDWITKKYIAWRGDAIGNQRSISDFAKMVDVAQPTMIHWMREDGKIPRSLSNIQKLVAAFGYEVYDILGLPRPESTFEDLPPEMGASLAAASTEILSVMEQRGIYDPDSPEAESIAIEIMAKHGWTFVGSSEKDDDLAK